MAVLTTALLLGGSIALTAAQTTPNSTIPNSWPQNYTGIPSGNYNTTWQKYFEVTDPLPNVTETLPRSFAGSISTDRSGHPNDTLFFWGFEKNNGSLTAGAGKSDEPWLIFLNGGPGSSSFKSFFTENGPLTVNADYSLTPKNYSWNKLADAFWIDQPVGTGFSTADSNGGYVNDEEEVANDFLGFLSNLVKVFPGLATRPFYLIGQSYAGQYIPYISKALFSSPNPPVQLKKVAIGDGAIGSLAGYEELSTVTTLETHPQLINFDVDVLNYFKAQEHLCGYDLNLTYPQQNGTFPSLLDPRLSIPESTAAASVSRSKRSNAQRLNDLFAKNAVAQSSGGLASRDLIEREESSQMWKRNLSDPGTLDPYYGCALFEEMMAYVQNYSFPWTVGSFDPYFVPDALKPEVAPEGNVFLNDNRTRNALHAPISKDWTSEFTYPWGSTFNYTPGSNQFGDPSVEPAAFFTDLATNASLHNVSMVLYSGNEDPIAAHRGTEVVIQNTTFGGIQGFTRKPSTPWYDDNHKLAGIVHQERNLTYALFLGAGHQVPMYQPEAAYVFLREFILGSNTTGLLLPNSTTAIGGEDPHFAGDIIPGTSVVFYGSGTTASSTAAPSASFASWASYLANATSTPNHNATASSSSVKASSTASSGTATATASKP